MRKIGFAATYGFGSINDAVIFAARNGFSAVEINLNMPEFYPERYSKQDIDDIRRLMDRLDIAVTFHAPEDINFCTKQGYILEASIKRIKECIDFASALGGLRFTFHIGDSVNFTMFDRSIRMEEYYLEDYVSILSSSLDRIREYASGRIVPCAENTGFFREAKTRAIEPMLGNGLYLTWDIGHSYIKKEQQDFMIKNIKYVRNAHLHDVAAGKDHCIIGTGEMDFAHYISLLNDKDIFYVIEVRPGEAAASSLKNLRRAVPAL